MKNAVLIFLVLMALLGVGTVLIVEKYSGEQILPRSIKGISLAGLGDSYKRGQRAFKRWWNKAADKVPELAAPASVQEGNTGDKKIIKWQDERGVWHYEYAGPGESGSPAPPP